MLFWRETENRVKIYLIRVAADRSFLKMDQRNDSMFHSLHSQDSAPSRDQNWCDLGEYFHPAETLNVRISAGNTNKGSPSLMNVSRALPLQKIIIFLPEGKVQ